MQMTMPFPKLLSTCGFNGLQNFGCGENVDKTANGRFVSLGAALGAVFALERENHSGIRGNPGVAGIWRSDDRALGLRSKVHVHFLPHLQILASQDLEFARNRHLVSV